MKRKFMSVLIAAVLVVSAVIPARAASSGSCSPSCTGQLSCPTGTVLQACLSALNAAGRTCCSVSGAACSGAAGKLLGCAAPSCFPAALLSRVSCAQTCASGSCGGTTAKTPAASTGTTAKTPAASTGTTAKTPAASTGTTAKPATPVATQATASVQSMEKAVADLVNQERAKNGLSALTLSTTLSNGARMKSQDMHDEGYFDHNSPKYGTPFAMMSSLGISYTAAGENIAKGYATAEAVMTAWMNSSGHRANILSSEFTSIGVGYVADGNYWTQWFIR